MSDVPLGVAWFDNKSTLLSKAWNWALGPVMLESQSKWMGILRRESLDAIVGDLTKMFGRSGRVFGCVEDIDLYSF